MIGSDVIDASSSGTRLPSAPVIWITGVSGVGKTTIGERVYQLVKRDHRNSVFLDGDHLRQVIADDLGHTLADRSRSAMRNSALCKFLSDQGINVICATISLFHDCQDWNRRNIPGYLEILVRAKPATLRSRDPKGIYADFDSGRFSNVVGLDLPAEYPVKPDIELLNDGDVSVELLAADIFEKIRTRLV